MFKTPTGTQFDLVDLHGMSVKDSEKLVKYRLQVAARTGIAWLRFVTGRGNHVNANGTRGVLFKLFKQWTDGSEFKDQIEKVEEHNGYYEVHFRPQLQPSRQAGDKEFKDMLFDNEKAEFKRLADQGDPSYQCLYAARLEEGKYISQDYKQAFTLYLAAAQAGYPPAMHNLARCYLHGVGTRLNDKSANEWLDKADKAGIIESTLALGDSHLFGRGVPYDSRKALSYYVKAASKNMTVAMRKIASGYLNGNLTLTKDPKKAFEWYKKAADLGDAIAEYNVASMYLNGLGTLTNKPSGYIYLERSAKHGDPDGQAGYGDYLLYEKGDEKSKREGIAWLQKAAASGSEAACTALITLDPVNKEKYKARAAESGNIFAVLDKLTQGRKNFSDEEYENALQLAMKNAEVMETNDIILLSDSSKYFLLDEMLASKKKHLFNKAIESLVRMSEHNDVLSIRRLTKLYFHDFGIRNEQQVVALLKQGVTLKDSKCMIVLGYYSQSGTIVEKSKNTAKELYELAAKSGNPNGYFMLAQHQFFSPDTYQLTSTQWIPTVISNLTIAIDLEKSDLRKLRLESGTLDCYSSVTSVALKWCTLFSKSTENNVSDLATFEAFVSEEVFPFITENIINGFPIKEVSETTQDNTSLLVDAMSLKTAGNRLAGQGQYREAIAKYEASIKIDSTIAAVWLNKGLMHKKLAEYNFALAAFDSALEIDPGYIKAQQNKAQILNILDTLEKPILKK